MTTPAFFEATLFASQRLPRALKESLQLPRMILKQAYHLAILHFDASCRKTSAVETLTFNIRVHNGAQPSSINKMRILMRSGNVRRPAGKSA